MSDWETVRLGDVCDILDNQRIPITASERVSGPYPYYGANGVQDYVADYIFDDELVLLAEDGGNFGSKDRPIAYRISGKCWVNNHAHVLKPKKSLDIDYLCYSIMFYDVSKLINGATRAKLNQAAVKLMEIPLPPLEEQRRIAETLDLASSLIEKRKRQIELLDTLAKSLFIEMFDDGTQYEQKKLIDLIYEGAGLSYGIVQPGEDLTGTLGIIRPVDIQDGKINLAHIKYIDENLEKNYLKTKLSGNELLITVRGTTGLTALTDQNHNDMNVTRGIAVIRYNETIINKKFLNEYLKSEKSQRFIQENTRGATLKQINLKELREHKIPLPSLTIQNEFAKRIESIEAQKYNLQNGLEKLEMIYKVLMQMYFEDA